MTRVDCQSHVFPAGYAELLLGNWGWVTASKADGRYVVTYGDGAQVFEIRPDAYSIQKKLSDMDRNRIDVSVLSLNIPGPEILPCDRGIEAARLCNDEMATICGTHSGRFVGLAVIPWQDVDAALFELRRATEELGLSGLTLFSHLNGKPVDAGEFDRVYAYAEEHRIPLVIHPAVPIWGGVIRDHSMIPMLGMMVDSSIAMLRLILGGVMERHPDLLIVHPHCGGILPYLMPRVVEQTEIKGRGRANIVKSPDEYYRNVYLDIVSPSARAIRFAYDTASPARLLFGSDHPWVPIETILACADDVDMPQAHREMLMGDNAVELFQI